MTKSHGVGRYLPQELLDELAAFLPAAAPAADRTPAAASPDALMSCATSLPLLEFEFEGPDPDEGGGLLGPDPVEGGGLLGPDPG